MRAKNLEELVAENVTEMQPVFGHFDADRVPKLTITSFEGVKDIRLSVSPDCSYRLVRDALAAAKTSIDLYIYNASADHMLDLLHEAKARGVAIRVMYDVMDTRGDERTKLKALHVELKEAPSSGRRQVFTVCHQKFAVIDGKSLVIGSANWASTSIPKVEKPGKFKKGNREWIVHITHGGVASFFAGLFNADWEIPALEAPGGLIGAPMEIPPEQLESRAPAVTLPAEIFDVEAPGGAARITPILSPDNYFKVIKKLVEGAQTSIAIQQQYIVAGGPRTKDLLQALAARKGEVDIRIVVSPAFAKNWNKTVETLEAAGLRECLRAINLESFTHLHNKGVLVDSRFTVVTSTNMSENSLTQAREAGVLIESSEVGDYFQRAFDVDWKSGLDPDDVATKLVELDAELAHVVEDEKVAVHSADLRML